MKKIVSLCLVVGIAITAFFGSGCAKKSASASEAIKNSQTMGTVQEKVDYLIAQAKLFYNSKQYQDAVQAAQYVLNNIDRNSQAAKDMVEKATTQLKNYANKAASDMGNKLFGK